MNLIPAIAIAAILLSGCAIAPSDPGVTSESAVIETTQAPAADWHPVPLPGKTATSYHWGRKEGRVAVVAKSDCSASMFRRKLAVAPEDLREVSFSWWVQELIPNSSVAHADREDAPARVLFGFDGDIRKLNLRTRVLFELAEALSGEKPPYATLMYVWDAEAPVGTVIVNPRSDRIRKIVVDSGPSQLRRWREHRRDLAADFRLAFGEAPGNLVSMAVMTDSDNTASTAAAWYGEVHLH